MKARLIRSMISTGTVARDYIQLVEGDYRRAIDDTRLIGSVAHEVLETFAKHNRPLPSRPILTGKNLIKVLNEDLKGIPIVVAYGDGKTIGDRLFIGCYVRLVGIPERKLIVDEIFWDHEAVRVKDVRKKIYYTVPWDAVEFYDEK